MRHFIVALAFFTGILRSSPGASNAALIPVETTPLILPKDVGPFLVLVDRLPGQEGFVEARADQVAIALRHFSAKTSWEYVDAAPFDKVRSAFAVVYLGLNGNDPLSSDALARLRLAHHLIVSRYHLARLREAGIAFKDTEGGTDVAVPQNTLVRYKGQRFPTALPDFLAFIAHEPAHIVADYEVARPAETSVPYIVQDGDALFVNGDVSFYSSDATLRGVMLTACDAITKFIGANPLPARPLAMLRLEDVSALTPAWRLDAIVRYLSAARVPYGIGLIPDLRVKGKVIRPLRDNREVLNVLHWAEEHGATIMLHGLHHCCSSDDAEGYEFWDKDHNAPLSHDSIERMRSTVREGLSDEIALGLPPHLWETPHYSASPVDYGVVAEFFGAAWELRRPIGWLPWVLRRDQYDTMILPENLGYVSLDGTKTVSDQLQRARELMVCQSCVAAGFLHPSTVPIKDVRDYVQGLCDLGYSFVDPAQAIHEYASVRTGAGHKSGPR